MSTNTSKSAKTSAVKSATKVQQSTVTPIAAASAKTVKVAEKAPLSALDGSQPAPIAKLVVESAVVESAQAVILGPVMRKKELIDAVVVHSGMKKKEVKPIVESMLEVLGGALAEKRELNMQPFGRVKVRREKLFPNGRMLIAKIRQNSPSEKETVDADTAI